MVDKPDLGSGASRRESSSLSTRTSTQRPPFQAVLFRSVRVERRFAARSFLCLIRGAAPNVPRGSRPSSFGPASAVRAEALIPLFDRQRCPPAAPHLCPKTPCFGHGAFRKPHRCPKTLHFGNKMLAPTIFVSRNGHFGARTPRRTHSDGQGLISGATPCPHFGHPGTSNGQGPHHEIRPCPLKCCGKGLAYKDPSLTLRMTIIMQQPSD